MTTYADFTHNLGIPSLLAVCPLCEKKYPAWMFLDCVDCKVELRWPDVDHEKTEE